MKWQIVNALFLSTLTLGCKHHEKMLNEQDTTRTHWGEVVTTSSSLQDMIEEIYVNPSALLWGDSVAIPPLPPATSFHYMCLSGTVPPPSKKLVPVLVRRIRSTEVSRSDSTAQGGNQSLTKTQAKPLTKKGSHWLVYVLVFLFVDIIGLFVYFLWRLNRKYVSLQ